MAFQGLSALPALQIDGGFLSSATPINAFRQGVQDRAVQDQRDLMKNVGQVASTGNYLDAARTAMAGGDVKTGMDISGWDTGRRLKAVQFLQSGAERADTPERWDALVNVAEDAFGSDLVKNYRDFNSRPNAITALQAAQLKIQQANADRENREFTARLPLIAAQTRYYGAQADEASRKGDFSYEKVGNNLVRINKNTGVTNEIYNGGLDPARIPAGYNLNPDGSLSAIKGGPHDPAASMKDYQTKDAMWAERLLRSEKEINSVAPIDEEGNPKGYNPARKSNAYFPDSPSLSNLYTANLFNSKDWQQYQQAAREGIAAILRKDTGAAVTDTEWNLYFPMYYPQPGDGPSVVAQKKRAREAAASALRSSSGPAFNVMFPNYGDASRPAQGSEDVPRARNPSTGEVIELRNGQWVPVR